MDWEKRAIEVLLKLTRELLEEMTLEQALQKVSDAALELLPGQHSSIRILDDSGQKLLSGARSGEGVSARPVRFKPGEGIAGWVAEKGMSVRIFDAEKDPRFKKASKSKQGFQVRSMVVVPLWSAGRVVGVLGVTSDERGAFGAADETMAMLLANCAVPPIEQARLARLAFIDHHTKAFNQRYLFPRLREEIERARRYVIPLSVLLLDLDHFKRVNDTHGHAAGDKVLRIFSERIQARIRHSDVVVRRGGEEFVIIMPQTNDEQAGAAAERIRDGMASEPFDLGQGVEISQTVSIGVATWDGRETAESLEKRADQGMYRAKRQGRDRVALAPISLEDLPVVMEEPSPTLPTKPETPKEPHA
jgi:diguanylate cyclase (GGDEF)-like protein